MNPFQPLCDAIIAQFPALVEDDLPFGPAPKVAVGDVALPTFLAARKLGGAPPALARQIAESVSFGSFVTEVSVAGPYLNFRLNRGAIAQGILQEVLLQGERYGSNNSGANRSVHLEHTSINPNASPHVGRARNAMIGDSLARLFKFEGFDTTVHYYVNDMGRQIGLLSLYCEETGVLRRREGGEGYVLDMPFDDVLAAYVAANERAASDEAFAAEGFRLLALMEEGDADTRAKFYALTDACLKGQLGVLERLGATYDSFDRESDFIRDERLDRVQAALKEKEALFLDEDERWVVDLSKIGHELEEGRFLPLLRSNGSSMYVYRDLAYTLWKLEQGGDVNVAVFGEDHKLYAHQVGLILKQVGMEAPETVTYSYIVLKEGKMSTRQGKVVLLSEFLDEAARRSLERVREQCTDLTTEEQDVIAAKIAVSAIRFAILRVSPNKNVTFDWDASLSFTGDTGPYVQYSCARINSILRKRGTAIPPTVAEPCLLDQDAEWELVMKLASFGDTVASAINQRNLAPMASYALEVAHLFTSFYHACPVLTAESEALQTARAQLCAATLQTLKNALTLLGIEAPERM